MAYLILNALFLAAYLLSALVQYNDPDPWAWVAIYLATAAVAFGSISTRFPWQAAV